MTMSDIGGSDPGTRLPRAVAVAALLIAALPSASAVASGRRHVAGFSPPPPCGSRRSFSAASSAVGPLSAISQLSSSPPPPPPPSPCELQGQGYGDVLGGKNRRDGTGRVRWRFKWPALRRAARRAVRATRSVLFPDSAAAEPGTLVLVRHGESEWNANKTFTGWADPDLSERGYREIEHAARLLLEGGYELDVVFTSRLKRAIRSAALLLQELNEVYLPVFKSWRLNERMYGALQGLSKAETAETLGHELVQAWRGSLRSRPPSLRRSDERWPGRDRRYADLPADRIPVSESLLDCMVRTEPLWEDKIRDELALGRNVMVVAHANTLRGLVKIIDGIGDDEIQEVAIPTGIPIIYKFDASMKPVPPSGDRQTAAQVHMNGLFLEKPGLLKEALKREEEWSRSVPGYDDTMARFTRPSSTSRERSLHKLNAVRELGEWAGQFIDDDISAKEDDGNDGTGQFIQLSSKEEDELWDIGLHQLEEGLLFDPDYPEFHPAFDNEDAAEEDVVVRPHIISRGPATVSAVPAAAVAPGIGEVPIRRGSVIVIIRHGKTEHNQLGLFTGWEDAPLAEEGIEEAKEAGRLLKLHGFEFDVCYTSWLSRAVETAWYVMDELDCWFLPMIKTWRLNERMYGSLTGLSKKMVAQRHGEKQFKAWRRGYKTRPPKVSSFSTNYPGNDRRYERYVNDVRPSIRETLIRSIERQRLSVHRKLPKTESLKNCMDRTIPYFTDQILPEAVEDGKRILISSSENAIRGLLMHLCDIPVSKITGLEIPNGLPIIYDVESRCVKLLDDGSGEEPLKKYNFGEAGSYLFKQPCLDGNGEVDEECSPLGSAHDCNEIELPKVQAKQPELIPLAR